VNLLVALLLTISIEFFPVYFLTRKSHDVYRIVFFVVAVNAITNPVANVCYPALSLWLIEPVVVAAEALLFTWLFRVSAGRGVLLSLAANIPTILLSVVSLQL